MENESEKKPIDPAAINPLSMKRAEMLFGAHAHGKVALMHVRTKHGEEVDALVILRDDPGEDGYGSIVPVAFMINDLMDLEPPEGTRPLKNPRLYG